MDVCVVGAGIIGAATAFHLARLGAQVTVIEATQEPRGASAATFGWINANGKKPEHYFELNRAGMEAHGELARILGDDSWLHADGSLEWTGHAGGDELAARVADHAARGYRAELVSAAHALRLEPELAPGLDGAKWDVALFAKEGWVDTVALIAQLLRAAERSGAVVRRGVRVTAMDWQNGRSVLALDDGQSCEADVVVNCAGPDAGDLAALVGLSIETAGAVGLNAVTGPAHVRLTRVVRAPGVHFRPETGGRVMIATTASDTALAGGDHPEALAKRNVEAASRCLSIGADEPVEESRVARRAIPPDGLPIVGRLDETPWLYHVVTHSGVTLAPLLGRLVAEEIVHGSEHDRLAPYRPARFAASLSS